MSWRTGKIPFVVTSLVRTPKTLSTRKVLQLADDKNYVKQFYLDSDGSEKENKKENHKNIPCW